MAELNTSGLEELARCFRKNEQKATETVERMLNETSQIYLEAQKQAAISYGIRRTGGFISSIKRSEIKREDKALVVTITPDGRSNHTSDGGGSGKKRKGKSRKENVRYATIGFVFEYGTSSLPARPWLTLAEKRAKGPAERKTKEIWNQYMDESFK